MRVPAEGRRRARAGKRALAALLIAAGAAPAAAAPYVPQSDATVLERVPARTALERLAPLRRTLTAHPQDLEAALALAQGYVAIGRETSDPRFVAYAEATLVPWLRQARPPEPALILQATALQYLHRFDDSLALLDRAVALQPLDPQAWLTRAGLLEIKGDFRQARAACAHLMRVADALVALTCLTSVDSRSGRLAESYARLRVLPPDQRLPRELRSWMLGVRADMAERLGDDARAANDYAAALELTPKDPYLKCSYADLLLRLERPAEVLALLAGSESQDPLLVRLAIAARRIGDSDAARLASLYQARFEAAQRDGSTLHLREGALYLLELRDDPGAALELARRNFALQREPADVRLYARALARGGARSGEPLTAWLQAIRYEDRTLPVLTAPPAPGTS